MISSPLEQLKIVWHWPLEEKKKLFDLYSQPAWKDLLCSPLPPSHADLEHLIREGVYTVQEYSSEALPLFSSFFEEEEQKIFKTSSSLFFLGATLFDSPLAVLVVQCKPKVALCEITSMKSFFGASLLASLLRYCEDFARHQEMTLLQYTLWADSPFWERVSDLFAAQGYQKPTRCKRWVKSLFDPESFFASTLTHPFLKHWKKLLLFPKGFELFSWLTLSEEERDSLQRQSWYSKKLSPFIHEEWIEPINSLGLRYKGEVVGWYVTHRYEKESIHYHSLCLKPALHRCLVSIPLIGHALLRHYHHHKTIPYSTWSVWDEFTEDALCQPSTEIFNEDYEMRDLMVFRKSLQETLPYGESTEESAHARL